jgi:hypothetical protein
LIASIISDLSKRQIYPISPRISNKISGIINIFAEV